MHIRVHVEDNSLGELASRKNASIYPFETISLKPQYFQLTIWIGFVPLE